MPYEQFVKTNTVETSEQSLTPQLRLRLITPACDLYSATEQDLADLKAGKGIDVCTFSQQIFFKTDHNVFPHGTSFVKSML